jgi:hypothetical protein
MNMTVLTPIILFAASVVAMGCAYSALPSQRWWSHPLRPFPAHATAALASMVALRGWIDVLGVFHGGLAWLSTLGVPLAVLFLAAASPRHSLRSLWVRRSSRGFLRFQSNTPAIVRLKPDPQSPSSEIDEVNRCQHPRFPAVSLAS